MKVLPCLTFDMFFSSLNPRMVLKDENIQCDSLDLLPGSENLEHELLVGGISRLVGGKE